MYIRRVSTINGVTKKKYSYLKLVESVRTESGPRQKLVLNLGDLPIDKSQFVSLARRIEDILSGRKALFETDPELEQYARDAADKIFTQKAEELNTEETSRYEQVDTRSFEVHQLRSLGAEYVCHKMWERLKLSEFFKSQGISEQVIPVLESLVVGRLIEPASERWTREWAEHRSALYELCGKPKYRSLQSFYRGSDTLLKCKDALEEYLSVQERSLFDLKETLVLYDLTNTYFEGTCKGNPKAAFGKSKEKRSDCRLETLALVVDGQGFVKYSKLYMGNQYEADTFADIISELAKRAPKAVLGTVVMDAGIASNENLQLLKEKGYTYLVVNRGKAPVEMSPDSLRLVRENVSRGVKIEVKSCEHDSELYLVVRSEQKRQKEASMMSRVEQFFLERLDYYRTGLDKKHRTKNYSKVVELIGRLKEKYSQAACCYDIEVIPDEKKDKAIDIRWEPRKTRYDQKKEQDGSYILRTNRKDLTEEQIWETYLMLARIESAFKSMKSHLGMRPNFHQKGERVDAHLFISVLAYHLLHSIEHILSSSGDNRSWKTIKALLSTHQRLSLEYIGKDVEGTRYHTVMRMNSSVEPKQREVYTRLGISSKPLARKIFKKKISSDKTLGQLQQRE